jgi:predicted GNAT family acetyltransferase
MGAGEIVEEFSSRWEEKSTLSSKNFTKRFIIYESTRAHNPKITEKSGNLELVQASELEWPRIRLWAANFAEEASPALNREATIMMAKSMLKNKNLYLLRNGIQSLAMAGFGRNTPNRMVINMVFTPPEFRGKKYASHLVSLMIKKAQKNGFSHTLLFSDYLEQKNLYQTIGCKPVGEFCEMKLFE